MACHPPIGEVKGQCRGKKADQKEKDSRVPVLSDEVEESFSIRQGSMILPLRVRFPWHEIHHKARSIRPTSFVNLTSASSLLCRGYRTGAISDYNIVRFSRGLAAHKDKRAA